MPLSKAQLPVRKLCSCNAVLCSPVESKTAPDTDLFGVILLNSPDTTEADFAEYVRLFQLYRGGGGGTDKGVVPRSAKDDGTSPYFLCADGAHAGLRRFCAAKAARASPGGSGDDAEDSAGTPDSGALTAIRLCDVLIGDMDSLSPTDLRRAAATSTYSTADAEGGPSYYETVDAVPVALLEMIRKRRAEALQRRRNSGGTHTTPPTDTPVVLPVACQMSTDFCKCVALLERLRRLEQDNTDVLSVEEQADYYDVHQAAHEVVELMKVCDAQLERACEDATRQANGDAQEAQRCRRLLMDVSPTTSSTMRTRVLPNVVVLGALGGRMDHEIGVMTTVMRFARIFHLMVVNKYNVLFACWPDGVTQLLMPPSWTPLASVLQDAAAQQTATEKAAVYMCGIVPFGTLREMETTGCLWNIVKNRRGCYDGFTGVDHYRFAFDGLVSVCNIVSSRLVTADVRPTTCDAANPPWDPEAPSANPPTLFMLGRPKPSPGKDDAIANTHEKTKS